MNPEVFREYDVRGVVDRDLNPDFVRELGQAIGAYALQHQVRKMTVGRDCRLSSETYLGALTEGMRSTGIDVIDVGLCSTGMLYYSIRHLETDGGVMITGSHNPPEFNGFKICVGKETIHGHEIQNLRIIAEENLVENARIQGECFLTELQALAHKYPAVTAVRGRGLMLAFDLPNTAVRDAFWKGAYELGLLVVRSGERSIRLRPVLDVKDDIIHAAIPIMDELCRRL